LKKNGVNGKRSRISLEMMVEKKEGPLEKEKKKSHKKKPGEKE